MFGSLWRIRLRRKLPVGSLVRYVSTSPATTKLEATVEDHEPLQDYIPLIICVRGPKHLL